MKDIGKRINQIRRELNLSQVKFAKLCNLNSPALSQYEAGVRKPSLEILILLANKFNLSLDWLILGKTPKDKEESKMYAEIYDKLFLLLNTSDQQLILLLMASLTEKGDQ
jgi:transcriptional regulator with XRE-family HTH domain